MIFSLIKTVTDTVGTIAGSIIGLSIAVIAETLGVAESAVERAKEAGCTTYEEIREFLNID